MGGTGVVLAGLGCCAAEVVWVNTKGGEALAKGVHTATQCLAWQYTTSGGSSLEARVKNDSVAPHFQNGAKIRDLRCVLHPSTRRCWVHNTP